MTPNAKPSIGSTDEAASRRREPTAWNAFAEAMGGLAADIMYATLRAALACARWHRRQVAVEQLQALDDRMLKDIGIERGQIVAAVQGIDRRTAGGRTGPTHTGRLTSLERRAEVPPAFGGTVAS